MWPDKEPRAVSLHRVSLHVEQDWRPEKCFYEDSVTRFLATTTPELLCTLYLSV